MIPPCIFYQNTIMLPTYDYLEIKDFLQSRVREINITTNQDRKKQRELNTKYRLPNTESFGWMPAITICYSFDIGDNQIMYMIPFLSFYRHLSEFLPQAIFKHPDFFGTKDADDVIAALYNVSGYCRTGNIDAYKQYLIDNACCYFLLRDKHQKLSSKIFRLDLFRHVLPNDRNTHDFNGGLMHAFRHCSWNNIKLSSGNGETELNDLWDLPLILGKAILLDKNLDNDNSTLFKEGERTWEIKYFVDPDTQIYYLKTAYAKSQHKVNQERQ